MSGDRLAAELGLQRGAVPAAIDDARLTTPTFQIGPDAFLLRLPSGLRFFYRRGAGTVFAGPATVPDEDVALFFEGSVYGAIAWLNGLVPLHASAVTIDGCVFAFSGISGEGKSTLAAALARRGLAPFCDDVLAIDLADPAGVRALRGPRRLKLWQDALALTDSVPHGQVRVGIAKYYVPGGFAEAEALPVHRLYLLESTPHQPIGITPILGAERFNAVRCAYYRPHFCAAIVAAQDYFSGTLRLSQSLAVARFNRSRDKKDFDDTVSLIEADIRAALD